MELITYSQCACANCGHVIDYLPGRAGEVVECPKCREKSRLPEPEKLAIIEVLGPPVPESKACAVCGSQMQFWAWSCPACKLAAKRKVKLAFLITSALVVIAFVVLAVVHPFQNSASGGANTGVAVPVPGSNGVASQPHILIEQPRPRMPKSTNDLRVGRFTLEKRRGSDLAIAVGDIVNDSENVHTSIRADLDVLDKNGVKIGTASDYFTELNPHQSWHFLVTVPETNAFSVRFAGLKEN